MVYKLSQSSLKLMQECPTCFWWQVKKKVRRPSGPMSQLPNRVEDQILLRFNKFRLEGELPPELKELVGFKLLADIEKHKTWKNKGLYYTDEERGFTLVAKPDDVLEHNSKLCILDYKTAGTGASSCTTEKFISDIEKYGYKLQSNVYNYVFRKNNIDTEDSSYFLFLYIKESDDEGKITLGSELVEVKVDLEDVESKLIKALDILNKEEAPENGCEHCLSVGERN